MVTKTYLPIYLCDSSDSCNSSDSCDSSDGSESSDTNIYVTKVFFFLIVTTQKVKFWQNLKTQIVTKLTKSNLDKSKTWIVSKLKNTNCEKELKNSNCKKYYKKKCDNLKHQIGTKLKNWNCEKKNSKHQILTTKKR